MNQHQVAMLTGVILRGAAAIAATWYAVHQWVQPYRDRKRQARTQAVRTDKSIHGKF